MKYAIASVFIVIFLSGCVQNSAVHLEQKTIYIKKRCPKFNSYISISVKDLNSTHAAISWVDVAQIEAMVSEKKKFNKKIQKINKI